MELLLVDIDEVMPGTLSEGSGRPAWSIPLITDKRIDVASAVKTGVEANRQFEVAVMSLNRRAQNQRISFKNTGPD